MKRVSIWIQFLLSIAHFAISGQGASVVMLDSEALKESGRFLGKI